MDAKEIDAVFDAFEINDLKFIWEISGIQEEYSEDKMRDLDEAEKVVAKVYEKIKQGDFEHFKDKIINGGSIEKEIGLVLIMYSHDAELIKDMVANRKKYGLDKDTLMTLIVASKDYEFIDQCIDKREELGLTKDDVVVMMKATRDPDYIEKCIERREELGLDKSDVVDLINAAGSPELTSKYIDKRDEFGFDRNHIWALLMGTTDTTLLDKCLAQREELGLTRVAVVTLIRDTNNPNYIEKCIERRKELGLTDGDTISLIYSITDPKRREGYIERRKELGLTKHDIIYLIRAMGAINPAYIEKYIDKREEMEFDSYSICSLLSNISDTALLDRCLKRREELGLGNIEVKSIIIASKNPEYMKKCLGRVEELGLTKEDVLEIIGAIGKEDPNFIRKAVEDGEHIGLSKDDISYLIIETNDTEFMMQCIDRKEELGLEDKHIVKIALSMQNEKSMEVVDELIQDDETRILLPADMTIGAEIESIGKESNWLHYKLGMIAGWKCKSDSSIEVDQEGEATIEVVSPILTGDAEESTRGVKRICTIMEKLGQHTNPSCGGHVHIGKDYLTNPQAGRNLAELWANTEVIMYIIGNKPGELPREGVEKYAGPVSGDMEKQIEEGSLDLKNAKSLEQVQEMLEVSQDSRYKGINFKNLNDPIKRTYEFRHHNGTTDAKTWIENINLDGGLLVAAERLSHIQEKDPSERTEEEKHLLECFDKIRSDEIDEKEKMELLLELTIPEEKAREAYRLRYEKNSELLKQNPKLEKIIRGRAAKKSVVIIKKEVEETELTEVDQTTGDEHKAGDATQKGDAISEEEIGRAVLTGEDRITGGEHKVIDSIIRREREEEREDPSQDSQID